MDLKRSQFARCQDSAGPEHAAFRVYLQVERPTGGQAAPFGYVPFGHQRGEAVQIAQSLARAGPLEGQTKEESREGGASNDRETARCWGVSFSSATRKA